MDISIQWRQVKHRGEENTTENSIFFFSPHDKLSLENLIQVIKLKLPFLTI